MPEDTEDFKSKYMRRLDKELGNTPKEVTKVSTEEYLAFKSQYLPKHLSFYEKSARLAGKILKVGPGAGDAKRIQLQKAIDITHLDITPTDAFSLAILAPVILILFTTLMGYAIPLLVSPLGAEAGGSMFLVGVGLITGLIMIYPLLKMPMFLANNWRMRASNQMVLAIFYIVTYMRHTSNYELAVDFAAEHLAPPLSLDLKKVIWDIETSKFENLKESMENYLETWKDWNREFIESMHLIESSLFENVESRRLDALDKSLSVMLNETYERMLHYSHNLKSPLQALHMLGVVLPILGMVILPLIVSFMPEVEWYHVMVLYNVIIPVFVYLLGKDIMSKRPTGYGETNISNTDVDEKKLSNIVIKVGKTDVLMSPMWLAASVFAVLFFIGFLPLLLHVILPGMDYALTEDGFKVIDGNQADGALFYFLGYRPLVRGGEARADVLVGPFGLGATLFSLLIPLSFGLSIGLYHKMRTKNLIIVRRKSKTLEEEFASALFQLGNRLGDGVPAEIAFERVAAVMKDTVSGNFFTLVSINIRKLGMGLESAIFDPKKGALRYYPSNLIESSMKVLVQASKKGPLVASQALINVSEYIKQMHRVDERLRDLMADIVSDMKSQVSFLTPAIAGIVVGITSMITKILGSLGENMASLANDPAAQGGFGGGLMGLFGTGIPTFWFQIIVGLYVVEVVYILTILVNGIENGSDKLIEKAMLGKAMTRTTITYVVIASIIIIIFNFVAGSVITPFAVGAAG